MFLAVACAISLWAVAALAATGATTCLARDWACILDAATADALGATGENPDSRGRYLEEIADGYPESMRAQILAKFLAAAHEGDMRARLERRLSEVRIARAPDAGALDVALKSQTSPVPGIAFQEYVDEAFDALMAHGDQATVVRLWRKHEAVIWRRASQSETAIGTWLASRDPGLLADILKTRWLPSRSWRTLSALADRDCRSGDLAKAEALLAILASQRAAWEPDREERAMDLAYTVEPLARCRGFAAGEARLDEVLDLMKADIAAVESRGGDAAPRKFIIDTIRSEVGVNGVRPLVGLYLDQGREAEALRAFNRLPPEDSSMTLEIGADGSVAGHFGVTASEWLNERRIWADDLSQFPQPDTLEAGLTILEGAKDQDLRDVFEGTLPAYAAALLKFKGAKRPIALRLSALADKIAAEPGRIGMTREPAAIALAQTEFQLAGCVPSDRQLLEWQGAFAHAQYQGDRAKGRARLAGLIQSMDAVPRKGTDPGYGACVVAKP